MVAVTTARTVFSSQIFGAPLHRCSGIEMFWSPATPPPQQQSMRCRVTAAETGAGASAGTGFSSQVFGAPLHGCSGIQVLSVSPATLVQQQSLLQRVTAAVTGARGFGQHQI